MKSFSSIIILKKMSKAEIRAFDLYFKRLYFNKKVVWELFQFLKKYHPTFDSPKLERSKVALKLYGGDDKKLTETIHKLSELLKEFLVWNEIRSDNVERDFLQYQVFKKRGIDLIHKPDIKRVEEKIAQAKGLRFYEQQMRWHFLQAENPSDVYSKETSKLVQELIYDTDNYFLSLKAKLYCTAINRNKVLKHKFDYSLKEMTADALKNTKHLKKVEIAQVYYILFELTERPDEVIYDRVFAYFKRKYELFDANEQREVFSLLQNIVGMFPFLYQKKGSQKLFALYQFGLKSKIILISGTISPSVFNSIVNVCCKLGKVFWMEKFIFGYESFLPKHNNYDAFQMSKIRLDFEKKRFKSSLSKLENSNFKDIYYKLMGYVFRIKCNFELISLKKIKSIEIVNLDNIQKSINSMRRFLRDNKDNLKNRDYLSNQNFLSLFILIIQKKKSKMEIKKKLQSIGVCGYSEWLDEKVELLY